MTDWFESLPGLHAHLWATLSRGVTDRNAPARHPTLATTAPDGTPELRTLVLRAADPAAATLDLHTDLRSPKITSLRTNPVAALHIWDPDANLQIRLTATATILTGTAVAALWDRVPPASRVSYGADPGPGQPIPDALAYSPMADPDSFAVIRLAITSADLLHIGLRHRRARFDRRDDWAGVWLSP